MFAELAHGSEVRLLSALREASELQTLDHSLSQFSHGYTSKGKVEQPNRVSWTESCWAGLLNCNLEGLVRENDRVTQSGRVKTSFSAPQRLVQQIVGRERRERLSQLAWCGEGCFDSRRRVNSTVRRLSTYRTRLKEDVLSNHERLTVRRLINDKSTARRHGDLIDRSRNRSGFRYVGLGSSRIRHRRRSARRNLFSRYGSRCLEDRFTRQSDASSRT